MPAEKAGLPYETLEDRVLFHARFDSRKHGLGRGPDSYAMERVNDMNNAEFLTAISAAVEEMLVDLRESLKQGELDL